MFEHSSERADAVERLARDFGFVDCICRMHYAEREVPPTFCYDEYNRIWKEIKELRLSWWERQVVFNRVEIVT